MLSDKQRRTALKKNIAHARDMARRLLADGVEEITLTYYAHEGSFRAMRLVLHPGFCVTSAGRQSSMVTQTDVQAWADGLDGVVDRIAPRFGRPEPRRRARAYLGVPRSNPRNF